MSVDLRMNTTRQGTFPENMGLCFVTPIAKVNVNNKDSKNWRPIDKKKASG